MDLDGFLGFFCKVRGWAEGQNRKAKKKLGDPLLLRAFE
tara:strand:- start:4301 stop:4417 length:117 start_codon:yes stop_codon:yes gene_type:complete